MSGGIQTNAKALPDGMPATTCLTDANFNTVLTFDLATELRAPIANVTGTLTVAVCRRIIPAGYALRYLRLSVPAGAPSPVAIASIVPIIDGVRNPSLSTFAGVAGTAPPGMANMALSEQAATLSFDHTSPSAPRIGLSIACLKASAGQCSNSP